MSKASRERFVTKAVQEPDWHRFVERVTPNLATKWLEDHANPKNRHVATSDPRVQAYMREMEAGNWISSPVSPIAFDPTGMLLNGHHRLFAVRESGITCDFVVFRNVPYDTLRITDTNKVRTNGQIGKMFGEDTSLDAALKAIAYVRRDDESARPEYMGPSDLERYRGDYLSIGEENLQTLRSVKVAGMKLRAGIIAGFLLLLKAKSTKETATALIADLKSVADRSKLGHPATRNLVRWIEWNTGSHKRLASEAAAAVIAAHRQFAANENRPVIHPVRATLRNFIASVN